MAIQLVNFISGKLDNAVFYQRSGTWIVRSVPTQVKQSVQTKKRNQNFGIAAAVGRILRQQLGNGIPFPKDKLMQSRFSGAIIKWLGRSTINQLPPQTALPYLSGFSFNESCSLSSRCNISFEISRPNNRELQLHLPSFVPSQTFTSPASTTSVELTITATGCTLLQPGLTTGKARIVLRFDNNDVPIPGQTVSLPIESVSGHFLVTVASIRFINYAEQLIEKVNYLPAEIVDARLV